MIERVSYIVSWTRGSAGRESRTLQEWEPAIALYDDVVADRQTVEASLRELTERELRYFEQEARREHAAVVSQGQAAAAAVPAHGGQDRSNIRPG